MTGSRDWTKRTCASRHDDGARDAFWRFESSAFPTEEKPIATPLTGRRRRSRRRRRGARRRRATLTTFYRIRWRRTRRTLGERLRERLRRASRRTLPSRRKGGEDFASHVALPERWRFVDETVDETVDASSTKPSRGLGLIALKERMRRCVEGAPAEEDAQAEAVRRRRRRGGGGSPRGGTRRKRRRRGARGEARGGRRAQPREAAARRMDGGCHRRAVRGVARATTRDERARHDGRSRRRRRRPGRARRRARRYASKTLAASVIAAVLKKERAALVEAESSVASVRDAPETEPRGPWSAADFTDALPASSARPADPRVGPPPCLFAGLKFVVALLTELAEAKAALRRRRTREGRFRVMLMTRGNEDETTAGKETWKRKRRKRTARTSP